MGKHERSESLFEKGKGDHYGLYIASYEDEVVCKIGVSSDMRRRLSMLQGHSWRKVRLSSFFFAYTDVDNLDGVPDDYSITRVSAFKLESECHQKLKDLGVHLRGEFFNVFPDEAEEAVRKIAEETGFRLVTPSQVLNSGLDVEHNRSDRKAFLQLANAAALALEVMRETQHDGVDDADGTG